MNRIARTSFWTIVFGLIFLISVGSLLAQKAPIGSVGPLWEDTAINPHDFTNEYYAMNGVTAKGIIGRRTGTDSLSVFSNSSNPFHTNVRVIATIPAYDQNGDMVFWYPLGELQDYAFTDDKVGVQMQEMAGRFPIYIFPSVKISDTRTYSDTRQAALMDNSWSMTNGQDINPIGIREIIVVNFTEKAFGKEGIEMMGYFLKKNGTSADDTPIIRSMDDLTALEKFGLIDASPAKNIGGRYAISTPIYDPTNGAIAQDAFIMTATKDDRPLPAEDMFVWQFYCLQKTGNWCK